MGADFEEVNLFKYVTLVKSGVTDFIEEKKYIATGSLINEKIVDYELITYDSRPSRANMEFKKDDVIFAKMQDTVKVFLIDDDASQNIYSTGFAGLRIKDKTKILPEYLFYYILSDVFQNEKNKNCSGATQKAINNSNLKKFNILIPSIEIQKEIVNQLNKIYNLNLLRHKSLELSDLYLRSLFEEMFFNQNFEEYELKEFTSLISSGSTPRGGRDNYMAEGEILFIRSQNVLMNKFSNHDSLYIPIDIHNNMKRTWLKNKDVLLNITGASIGRTVVYEGLNDKANLNQHVCIIRLKDFNDLNPYYLNYYLSSSYIQNHIKKINAGATREALNFTQIGKFKILVPPIELQNQFAEIVQQVEIIKKYQNQSKEELDNLFNNLMQKAFKGELIC